MVVVTGGVSTTKGKNEKKIHKFRDRMSNQIASLTKQDKSSVFVSTNNNNNKKKNKNERRKEREKETEEKSRESARERQIEEKNREGEKKRKEERTLQAQTQTFTARHSLHTPDQTSPCAYE